MILFELPFPNMASLAPNRRGHWSKHEGARKDARWMGKLAARKAIKGAFIGTKIEVHLYFFQPNNVRRDDDNMIGAFKPYRDGIADALGIDDAKWKTHYYFPEKRHKGGNVIVKIKSI